MKHTLTLITTLLLAPLAANTQAAEPKSLSYDDIVSRLYDMKYLATKPQPGEKSGMFSSYDRKAKYNEQTGLYENWFANADDGSTLSRFASSPHWHSFRSSA
jgi:hypothetical protein